MAFTTIDKPTLYFNTKLYTGNNSTNAQTGVGFQPDLIWFKRRDSGAQHSLFDVVRGVTKGLASNTTDAETTISDALTSFDSDGFTLGSDSGNYINLNSATYASWNWKANGSGSSNADGTITSTVSANTTAGFSIVKWTGTASAGTIGHGLGVAPKVVLVKRYSTSGGGWLMQHGDLTGATYVIKLSGTGAEENDGANFNSAFPTSSVFSVYNSNNTNASGADHIAYCFTEKVGYSKFGKYTGNGNANGAFVYTGFKPAWLLVKRTDSAGYEWVIMDNKRSPSNKMDKWLYANTTAAEDSNGALDFCSNGFKIRQTHSYFNASGGTYAYMAFAKAPLVGSNNIPCTAR